MPTAFAFVPVTWGVFWPGPLSTDSAASPSTASPSSSDSISTDRFRLTFLIFLAEFKANAALFVTTMTTCYARFCAPLLNIKMSLMYFFLTVTLNRLFSSVKSTDTSVMNCCKQSSFVNSVLGVRPSSGWLEM